MNIIPMRKKNVHIITIVTFMLVIIGAMMLILSQRGEVTSFLPEFEENQTRTEIEGSVNGGIRIPGYSTVAIAANTKEVSVDLENPEDNEVYFKIALIRSDTNEQIFQSKLLAPGQHLYEITLEQELTSGEYPLIIQYETFGMDEAFTPKNGATINCVLKVS